MSIHTKHNSDNENSYKKSGQFRIVPNGSHGPHIADENQNPRSMSQLDLFRNITQVSE